MRVAVTERGVLWRDATDGAAQVLDRDCCEKPENSAAKKSTTASMASSLNARMMTRDFQ